MHVKCVLYLCNINALALKKIPRNKQLGGRERERRERQRDRERKRDRQTDRNRETETQRHTERGRDRDKQTERERDRKRESEILNLNVRLYFNPYLFVWSNGGPYLCYVIKTIHLFI